MYILYIVDAAQLMKSKIDLLGFQPTGIIQKDRYCVKIEEGNWYYQKLNHITGDLEGKWIPITTPFTVPGEPLNRYRFFNGLPVGEEWLYIKEDIRRAQRAYKGVS